MKLLSIPLQEEFRWPLKKSGFTLLEVMVAMTILGIGLALVMQHFTAGLRATLLSRQYLRAIVHAQEKMEELRLKGTWSNLEEGGNFEDGYRWKVSVSPFSPSSDQTEEQDEKKPVWEIWQLKSMVFWEEGKRERFFELQSLQAEGKFAP